MKRCKICQHEIALTKQGLSGFCSHRCRSTHRRQTLLKIEKKRVCTQCLAVFVNSSLSPICQPCNTLKYRKPAQRRTRYCAICFMLFVSNKGAVRCSIVCNRIHDNLIHRLKYAGIAPNYKSDTVQHHIQVTPKRKRIETRKEMVCADCSMQFSGTVSQKFCTEKCRNLHRSRHANHRRRAQLRRVGEVKIRAIYKRDICERDQWICQLCHTPVLPKHKYPHPMSASIDHIIPVSEGGHHASINVQLVHFVCNSKRGNKGQAQLRLLA